MTRITGTHIAYFHTCHRKLWLFGNGINMEHTSDTVAEGKLIGETSYADRTSRFTEIEIDGIKIDFYDARKKVIHEVKKSSKMENAHVAQLKYYIYKLEEKGVGGVSGILEYPRMKQREQVAIDDKDRLDIPDWERQAELIIRQQTCPATIHARICKSCSYHDLCYSTEVETG